MATVWAMPKPTRGSKSVQRPAQAGINEAVGQLMELADGDSSYHRLGPEAGRLQEMERRALGDRSVFDGLKLGKARPTEKRRDMQLPDERDAVNADELEEEAELEEIDPEDDQETDLDEDGDEGEDERAEAPRASGKELERALQALRRVKAPSWVFKVSPERQLELAESLSDFQRNTDEAIRRRDETIGALTHAIGGKKGERVTEASEESPAKGNAEDDLEEPATALVRAMGLENDPEAKKAVVDFGKKTRGQTGKALAKELGELRSAMREMLMDQATREFRKQYPEHASDTDAQQRFLDSLAAQARTGRYEGNTGKLISDAALLEFGPPKKRGRDAEGEAPRRKTGAPAMQTRAPERTSRALDEGTDGHDRAVFNRSMKRLRGGYATRR